MKYEEGFTLIELMITMTIGAILAAIALPQYAEYRARGYDAVSLSELRSVAMAEEMHYLDTDSYLACTNQSCERLPSIGKISNGVSIKITVPQAHYFTGTAGHAKGSGRQYQWDSDAGGLQD